MVGKKPLLWLYLGGVAGKLNKRRERKRPFCAGFSEYWLLGKPILGNMKLNPALKEGEGTAKLEVKEKRWMDVAQSMKL